MKKFNQMTEAQMSKIGGGLLIEMIAISALCYLVARTIHLIKNK